MTKKPVKFFNHCCKLKWRHVFFKNGFTSNDDEILVAVCSNELFLSFKNVHNNKQATDDANILDNTFQDNDIIAGLAAKNNTPDKKGVGAEVLHTTKQKKRQREWC